MTTTAVSAARTSQPRVDTRLNPTTESTPTAPPADTASEDQPREERVAATRTEVASSRSRAASNEGATRARLAAMTTAAEPTLRQGSRGDAVKRAQELLVKHGYLPDSPASTDGIFGPRTRAAAEKFQREHNLSADGVIGPRTWAALKTDPTRVEDPPPEPNPVNVFPRPNGLDEIKRVFGPAGPSQQVRLQVPIGGDGHMANMRMHQKIAPNVKAAFEEIQRQGLGHLVKTIDCSYNYRNKITANGPSPNLSTHSWGIAFDINADVPGYGLNETPPPEYSKLEAIFNMYGFRSGRSFNDPMHFQYADGY